MAVRSTAEEMERLQLSDDDTEKLWDSPSKRQTRQSFKQSSSEEPIVPEARTMQDSGDSAFDREEAREAALRNELQSVRNINEVLEGLLGSIDRAKGNMEVCETCSILEKKRQSNPRLFLSDCIANSYLCFNPSQHMDPYIVTDRTQSTVDSEP